MNRRQIIQGSAVLAFGAGAADQAPARTSKPEIVPQPRKSRVRAKDGTNLYVQDWGAGRPIVFLAAWTFDSTVWGEYITALSAAGHRCVAVDRRGHGRSDAPSAGFDLDTLAGDVASVFEQCDLNNAVLVAHSMGSIEAVRYLARQGASRVAKLVLIAPTTPFLKRTTDNPEGVPEQLIDAQNGLMRRDFAKWIADNEAPFFTPDTIPETRSWIKGMMLSVPLPVAMECRRTIAGADTRKDLAKLNMPVLIIQGDKDTSAPLPLTGVKTQKLVKGSRLLVYEGAPHAVVLTHRERLLGDISSFAL